MAMYECMHVYMCLFICKRKNNKNKKKTNNKHCKWVWVTHLQEARSKKLTQNHDQKGICIRDYTHMRRGGSKIKENKVHLRNNKIRTTNL